MHPMPQIIGKVDLAIGTGTQVARELQTFENTWNVPLKMLDLFDKSIAGISEISGIKHLIPSLCLNVT